MSETKIKINKKSEKKKNEQLKSVSIQRNKIKEIFFFRFGGPGIQTPPKKKYSATN